MKKKNFLTLALIASMSMGTVTSQGFTAYAATENGSSTEGAEEKTDKYNFTIKNTGKTAHKFEIYQIFKGELTVTDAKRSLSYIKWGEGVDTTKLPNEINDEDAAKVAAKLTDEKDAKEGKINVEEFAELISKALSESATATIDIDAGNEGTVALPAGYYFVKDLDGSQEKLNGKDVENGSYTQYILQIVGDTETETKLDAPSSLKKVKENVKKVEGDEDTRIASFKVGEQYNDVADYSIGDVIPYELVGTLPSNYDKYETYYYSFVDTMSEGLTLDGDSVKVYFRPAVDDSTEIELKEVTNKDDKTGYRKTVSTDDGSTVLNVSFEDLKKAVAKDSGKEINITKDSTFVVRYNASLNEKAAVGLPGNENEFHLEYSNNPNGEGHGKTPEDKNIVFTYEIDNEKVTYMSETDYALLNQEDKAKFEEVSYDLDGDGTAEKVYRRKLSGAKFKLFTEKGDVAVFSYDVDDNGKKKDFNFKGWKDADYKVAEGESTEVESDANGLVKIKGLDSGVYYLEETEAPSGYNKLTDRVKLELTAVTVNDQNWEGKTAKDAALKALTVKLNDKTEIKSDDNYGIVKTEIVNYTGSTLPSTGGIGTTIMYAFGAILVIMGGAAIIIKRRNDAA
ncbi:isopeptide-forming domain-containing fimbrial protein [Oribacterium sp. WCC10]|uniref:isopeptide-forming domain-containing fimbrial protein n=1 Tax=Oribacterium sp. WCC10 TaxID=1855343 RepID=UPI0008F39057|nr:isopeptide-forming domain-containing fimbrial protein [Oribacterium sp. WCC10]SFG63244.1 LPXTG-motif cell wall anchor domain-containing protein/fimbrial isopeptide formation D2 domain-containing protein [Oribacterium sp. WCC10]